MANSKSNIYPIQLQGAELCLNRYDAEIKQYRGFNKNNSPFVGGCLSNVFTKEEQIEGATDENTYIDTNGDKYTIDRQGLYKNGEKIIKYDGYASVFWEKEKITFPNPKDTVKVFADDLWLEKVTLGNVITYELKSSHGLPEPESYTLISNAGETEEEFLNQNIDSLCIQARQISWFILLRKTKAHNAQGNHYTGGVLTIYYFSSSQWAWIKCAHITISQLAYLKGLFFDSETRYLMTFVSANGSNQMWVARIVSTNNIEEIGLKTINGATTDYTQNSVFYSYFPDLQTINYPYNAFILNSVRNGSNTSTISSIPAMYINPYYDATNDLVKFRKIINLTMGSTGLYNWRLSTIRSDITSYNINTGTNTNLFRVYDIQINAQFQNSSQAWKDLVIHYNSEEIPNCDGYYVKNENGNVTANWTPGDYIKLGTKFHAAFNNNVLSGICGKYVLLTNWNTVKAENVIYLEKWVPWDEPAGSLILDEAVLIKENDEYYLLRNGKPKIKHGLNQIITNADSYQNSYDTVRNKVLFFAPALNSFKTNYIPVDPSASSVYGKCAIITSAEVSNPEYIAVALNEYSLEDNCSLLLNPVPLNGTSTLQRTIGNLPDVFVNVYSNRIEAYDSGVISTVVKYNYSSKFEDVYNASTFNNFKKKYDIDLIDLPFPIDTNGNVQYSPCLFGKVVSKYGNMAFYLEGAKGYPLMVSNNNQNVFSFYLGSEIENFETAFIIQGQYYGIIGENIFFMQYQNGVVTGLSFIVSRKGLQFVGNTPYEALFFSKTNRCLYSFTGSNVLNQKQLVDKISEVKDYLYNSATQTVFLNTDIGILFYGLFGMFLLELTNISVIYLLNNGIALSDNNGNYRYIKYYLDEGDTDYTKENINVETSFYGMNNEVVTINDCLYFRIFSEEHEEGDLKVSATTISLRGRKTEETTFKIKASDWDKITHTIYLRYQPKTQRGLGVAFAIDSPFKIASLSVGSQPDAVLVDKVSKGAITAPSVTTNNNEW